MENLEEYKIEINNHKYQYYDNLKEGDVLILIHGMGSNKDTMYRFLKGLKDDYRCIFIDLPSHNNIPSYEFDKLSHFATYIIDLIDYLKIKKPNLIGFSFGGLVAIQTAKQLLKQGCKVKTVAWASPLEKSFLTFRSKQFLKIFDSIQNKYYKKLPKSTFLRVVAAILGIKVKNNELATFTNFENTRIDKFHLMMPDSQIDTKDLDILYIFGSKDPLIKDSAFNNTKIYNQMQRKYKITKGGHYLSPEGKKQALTIIKDFINS